MSNRIVTTEELGKIKEYIESVRYGEVSIIIQDGKIVQLEKTEKVRIK